MPLTAHWIFGPQLIGALILLIGCIQYYFPPKHINSLYGYRTGSSQKNQETWDVANRYSAVYMIWCGLVLIGLGIITTVLIITIPMPVNIRVLIMVMLFLLSSMTPPILTIVNTEKHLTKLFGDK